MHYALSKPVFFLISMASAFTVFFDSFAFMVAKVNSSSGSWRHITVKAIGYTLPESEVLGSFDIEKTCKN